MSDREEVLEDIENCLKEIEDHIEFVSAFITEIRRIKETLKEL